MTLVHLLAVAAFIIAGCITSARLDWTPYHTKMADQGKCWIVGLTAYLTILALGSLYHAL